MTLKTTDALDFLTKERLAEMAETLVNLTALKREASYDLNTVGGDIDVVLISKFENITWLKKEKYFINGQYVRCVSDDGKYFGIGETKACQTDIQ